MSDNAKNISVIVPLLNELENLPELHKQLGHFSFGQVIYVDGGSDDGSLQWLEDNINGKTELLVESKAGRATQMNAGASVATQPCLLFLHADTLLPENVADEVVNGLLQSSWGRFDVSFIEPDIRMKIIAWFMNRRSRISSIATGDQAIFVRPEMLEHIGGFPEIPIMEDVEFSKRMQDFDEPFCSEALVKTSARRWLKNGVLKTVFLMWRLRFLYFMNVEPEELAKKYKNIR